MSAGEVVSVPAMLSNPWLESSDGRNFVDLTGPGSNKAEGISQSIPTQPGVTYTLKFFVGNVANSSTVKVKIDNTLAFTATNNTNGGTAVYWQPFSFTFVAGPTQTTKVTFLNGDPSTDNFNGLDNIAIGP